MLKAESGVKTAKRLLRKSIKDQSWNRSVPGFFFDYKNTPTQAMTTSLAQWLKGRRTETLLPTTQSLLMPKATQPDMVKSQLKECQQSQAKYYNRNARDLADLSKGDTVQMKPFKQGDKSWQKALVTARLDEQSYAVETESGAVYRRYKQHLRKMPESPIKPTESSRVSDLSSPNSVMPSTPISAAQPTNQPSVSSTDEAATVPASEITAC